MEVAIKVIAMKHLENDYLAKLLQNEINSLKKLRSPFIVRFEDFIYTKNNIYIVTEYCNSGDLYSYLKNKGPLPEAKVIEFLR